MCGAGVLIGSVRCHGVVGVCEMLLNCFQTIVNCQCVYTRIFFFVLLLFFFIASPSLLISLLGFLFFIVTSLK